MHNRCSPLRWTVNRLNSPGLISHQSVVLHVALDSDAPVEEYQQGSVHLFLSGYEDLSGQGMEYMI